MYYNSKKPRTLISFDWAMKSILKQPENFDILEGFLSALLGDDNIKILEILESESTQRDEKDKFNRVDLKAKDSDGKIIIVELQYNYETDYMSRIYYGTSKIVSEYMRIGRKYNEAPKVISINIVYFKFMKNCYVAKSETKFRDMISGDYLLDINDDIFADYYFIQPEWFDDNIKSALDEWVYMFKYTAIAEGSKSKSIEKAKEALDYAKMSPQEQSDYDYFWNISMRSARNTLEGAKEQGFAQGIEKGRVEEQKKAHFEKLESAKNLLKMGMTVEQVSQALFLQLDEVKELDIKND